ncbi:hypothetical protein [Rummeliibacillus sp. POC4]|nr:hypothetical protein [Rummeliibacillus sp. POC4]
MIKLYKSINQYFFLSDQISISDFAWFYGFYGFILTMLAIATIVFI